MSKVANALLARLKMIRDFDDSEKVHLFLQKRGLKLDVEQLAPGLLRLQPEVENQILSAYSKALTESSPNLNSYKKEGEEYLSPSSLAERQIMSLVDAEIKTIRSAKDIIVKIGFREEQGKDLKVGVILEAKGLFSYFALPIPSLKMESDEAERYIELYPVLAWVLDEESPLFLSEAKENLKRAVILERLFSGSLTQISVAAIRTQVRKFLDVLERSQNEMGKHFNKAVKKLEKALEDYITVEGFKVDVTRSIIDEKDSRCARAVFKVSGVRPLWFVLDVNFNKNWEHGLYLKDYVLWADRQSNETLSDDLLELTRDQSFELDLNILKWMLSKVYYRNSDSRSEKVYSLLAKHFSGFSFVKDGDSFKVHIKSQVELSPDRTFEAHRDWVSKSVQRLMDYCHEKNISISGKVEFFVDSKVEPVSILEFEKGNQSLKVLRAPASKPNTQVSALNLGIPKNINLKHIPHLSSLLSLTADPFDAGKKKK